MIGLLALAKAIRRRHGEDYNDGKHLLQNRSTKLNFKKNFPILGRVLRECLEYVKIKAGKRYRRKIASDILRVHQFTLTSGCRATGKRLVAQQKNQYEQFEGERGQTDSLGT